VRAAGRLGVNAPCPAPDENLNMSWSRAHTAGEVILHGDWVARINMVVALVIIAVLGFCLPITLFVIMRRRMSEPNKGMGCGEMDR
jgi:hypothetical protein